VNPEEKSKLAALFAQEHVAVIVTQGEQWPTATMQCFAETGNLDLVFIMGADSDKFQNLLKNPHTTVLVDNRDSGDVATFQVSRASIQGVAGEVAPGSLEWDSLKTLFLAKNPFEAPFFGGDRLRMIRVKPLRISYAGADRSTFKTEM